MNFLLLAGEIRQLCAGGESGTLFVTTENNHSVRIVVDAGSIVSIVAGRVKGAAVIARLKAEGVLRYRFQRDMVMRGGDDDGVPLALLEDDDLSLAPADIEVPDVSREALEIIRSEAVECMGPMAHMICEDHLRNVVSPAGMAKALAAISVEIGDAALAREFQSRVQLRLREREI